MTNSINNKRFYIHLSIIFILTSILFALLYYPLHRTNSIKNYLFKNKKEQIEYINSNMYLIPEIINLTKGYIIHDENALKDIISINILTQSQTKTINETYNNQLSILKLTYNLVENSSKNSLLSKNEKFQNTRTKFLNVYKMSNLEYLTCKIFYDKIIEYMKLPLYKPFIDTVNMSDIFWTV